MIEQTITGYLGNLVDIRRDIHAHPELAFEEHRTSALVADNLRTLGFDVTCGIAGTGVVGSLTCGSGGKSIGLRADMDALPMTEATGLPYSSKIPGKMHACGHDGHITMLLGAARYIAQTRDFEGTVHLIFQPAEEDIGGAKAMIDDGLFERFPCDAVFAMHNLPGKPCGEFVVRPGSFMASADACSIVIRGKGGHGAMPHLTVDPVVVGSSVVMALQTVVSRRIDPLAGGVVTVGRFSAGTSSNIIPETAELDIGVRSFSPEVREQLRGMICKMVEEQVASFGARCEIAYDYGYPVTVNSVAETEFVRSVALDLAGPGNVHELLYPFPVSEDFAFMLNERPGCYFGLGMGDEPDRPWLHDPCYDFNDDCLVRGSAIWANLVQRYLVH
ncbi:MAG: M20 family metallopeptidase [Hyphomicrobiales bacterium]|nr:M20 family metallopeptidase [Hyphomicrobiales bacterium]